MEFSYTIEYSFERSYSATDDETSRCRESMIRIARQ